MGDAPDKSPLAPNSFPDLPEIPGVRFATAETGIKYKGRDDLMLAHCAAGTTIAGVFTQSSTRSAAVLDCQDKIGTESGEGVAILVNAGNANAFTGRHGYESVRAITRATAQSVGVPERRVFTSSTGVIGEPLPHAQIVATLDEMTQALNGKGLNKAAHAIMTTDTFAKGATQIIMIDGAPVTIAGIAKGSGMIAPDMATMLVYIFTDAKVAQPALQSILSALNSTTFNCITVDSDTSTSDTVLVAATGQSDVEVTGRTIDFIDALQTVMMDLAHQVVRDGEGATKFIEVSVTGALSDEDARTHAMSIANSPLVKTAIAGEDANWGRVVMAIGKSGAPADRDAISIRFGDILVAKDGWVDPDYSEEAASAYMKNQELALHVDLGLGGGTAKVWTCDLTHGYIAINADYRS